MDRLFKSILSIREIKLRTDDDYVDRLSHQFTVIMLICFSFLVSTKQFVGRPIACWCPAQFTESHRDYTNTICWVSNTYYLPMNRQIPKSSYELMDQNKLISYYQWVPLILMFQAFLAFVPRLFWRFLNKRSGINLATIMDAAHVCAQASYLEIREKAIRYVVNQMDRYLLAQRDYRTGCCIRAKHIVARMCCLVGGRLYGNYLTSAYLVIKVIYVTNAVGQLFMLNAFLGMEYHLYGAYVLKQLINGEEWASSDKFPRVTICDFTIRHQSRLHGYIVQCVLTINLFNEKIFIFIWFWYVFLSIVSIVNLIKWLVRSLYWRGQVRYVRKQLRAFDTAQREPGVLAKFTESYLRRDGMFILRLIGMNMGEVIAGETLCGLWNTYSPERRLIAEKPGYKTGIAATTGVNIGNGGKSRPNGGQRMEVV